MTEEQAKAADARAVADDVRAARMRMQAMGFKKYRFVPGDDPINEFWFDPKTGVIVMDMHGQNVIHTSACDLAVFDPVIYPQPPKGSTEERILTRDGMWPL